MQLSARMLTDVNGVNSFEYANQVECVEGDGPLVSFQLIDVTVDRATDGFVPGGRRYIPAVGATLSVVIDSLNDSTKITRSATQPFATDSSIWQVQLMSTDPIRGTATMRLTLTEGIKITRGNVFNSLMIQPKDAAP
jgi:hypothetical protein